MLEIIYNELIARSVCVCARMRACACVRACVAHAMKGRDENESDIMLAFRFYLRCLLSSTFALI